MTQKLDDNGNEVLRGAGEANSSADKYDIRTKFKGGSILSEGNSSTTPLGSAETFTGTGEQNDMPHVGVIVTTDNTGTLFFEFSTDGTNWDSTFPVAGFKVSSGIPDFHTAVKLGRYFRVRFINDTGAQTYLRLATYYGMNFTCANHPYNQAVSTDTDATTTRPSDFGDEVVIGLRTGVRHFNKFSYRTGLTAANGEETIWATTGNFTPMTTASTFTIAYDAATDGLGTTGALTLFFDYLASDGMYATATHTLSNTGSDVTTFSGLGINRCAVSSSGAAQTNTNIITITETTGGTKQAVIPALSSTTQQAIYHTDHNSYAVGKFLWINTNKLSGSNPKITVKGYAFNRIIETRYEVFRVTIDTSVENTVPIVDPVGFRLSPSDVLYFVADTDTNNTLVNLRVSLLEYRID